MSLKVLTPGQVEEFIARGYTLLRDAFSREVAAEVRRTVLEKIGAREDDPATWTTGPIPGRNHLTESYPGEPFMSACTPRFAAALDDLMGEGRWQPLTNLGWWPVLFPGFDAPPWRVLDREWHIDGGFFHHHLDSAEQGMLPIFLFSDLGPGDGGTGIAVGSHRVAARVLRDAAPDGLSQAELTRRAVADYFHGPRARPEVVEAQGRAGDIALIHPFMLHTVSTNTGQRVRVICNPHVDHHAKMNVTREGLPKDPRRPLSPVERAIAGALGEGSGVAAEAETAAPVGA